MNINAIVCQIDQLAGQLHHNGMSSYTIDDLRSLAGSLEAASSIIYAEIRHRLDLEREANPIAPSNRPVRGLLADIATPSGGDAA